MKKTEYFAAILNIVENEYDVTMLFCSHHCRRTDLSDARTCVVVILYYDLGLNMVQIAELTRLSASGVCYLINRHQERIKQNYAYKTSFRNVRNKVFSNVLEAAQ